MEYPLLDISLALHQYKAEKYTRYSDMAKACGVSLSTLTELANSPKTLPKRKLGTLQALLGLVQYTLTDFDPRLTLDNAQAATSALYGAYGQGIPITVLAPHLGFTDIRQMYTVLNAIQSGRFLDALYGSLTRLLQAGEPEFDAWVKEYLTGSTRRRVVSDSVRAADLAIKHEECEKKLQSKMSKQDWLRRLAGQIGFADVANFNPTFEGGKMTFYTDTRAYKCVVTNDAFVAIWTATGTVSVRHKFKAPSQTPTEECALA